MIKPDATARNLTGKIIAKLEEAGDIQVSILGQFGVSPETLEFLCYDNNNNEVKCLPTEPVPVGRPRR